MLNSATLAVRGSNPHCAWTQILTVTCAIGAPPGHTEGSTLNIQGVINFNKHAGGITLFIKQ
jgi:hypothetical protein